ncbi:type IV secretory system conjugative DNA transfer family protein [Nocardia sp. MH4]|uniref:type IV secretory system conjugative DNA transfer family protein n=1 Tax=Nocardia sp. MH4 TaxID=1768677 RepID=UPI001C4F854B|nr:type IV secretory system conjugative DNA transfer family protein [Nocardia sp. MH4]
MNDYLRAPASCTPMITPKDCAPYAPTPVASPSPAPTEPVGQVPNVDPSAPPIPGADSPLVSWVEDIHLPDPSGITAEGVLDGLAVAGVLGGSVAAVTAAAVASSWLWTWTPIRLRNFAIGSCVLPGSAMLIDGWTAVRDDIALACAEVAGGMPVQGAATAAVATVPVGWAAAAFLSAKYFDQRDTRGFKSPARTDRAMWARRRREMAAATRMSATALPMCAGTVSPDPVIGRTASMSSTAPARSVAGRLSGRHESLFRITWLAMREHFVAIGNPGSGKTTMMVRAILSFWAAGWRRHQQWWRADQAGRPLAVIIDVKGARDARRTAATVRDAFVAMGGDPARFASWPDEMELSFFGGKLPADLKDPEALKEREKRARELSSRFEGLLGAGMTTEGMDPAEAYYLNMRKAVLHLVVDAPNPDLDLEAGQDPPASFFEYLARMDRAELVRRWASYPDEIAAIVAVTSSEKNPILMAERTAMLNISRELGESFDGTAELTDYDIVYCCLEGITSPLLAKAQFGALVSMLTMLAGRDHGRTIQLFCDEFAQVCGDSGAARIVELLRSAGVGSAWFSQSWMGLGANDDQRHRLVDSCSGGILAMRANNAGALAEKIGTRRTAAFSRKVVGGGQLGDEGNVQSDDSFIVSPAVLADFGPGDIVHVRGGKARFGHVSPLDISALRPLPGLAKSTTSPAVPAAVKKAVA